MAEALGRAAGDPPRARGGARLRRPPLPQPPLSVVLSAAPSARLRAAAKHARPGVRERWGVGGGGREEGILVLFCSGLTPFGEELTPAFFLAWLREELG